MNKASIVIPTLDAGPNFETTLEAISAQKSGFDLETIVVDSGSEDGTPELAEKHGAKVVRIPRSEFSHGGTRNLGISHSSGEFVALTVQDATPMNDSWLSSLVGSLVDDGSVAVAYSRHVPRPGAGPLTRAVVGGLAWAEEERRVQEMGSIERYRSMTPMEKRLLCAFDNVSSCVRRSVWEEFPFEETSFAEDLRWGKRAIESGRKIVYEPRSAVVHSHERGALYDLRRSYVDALAITELFDARLVPNLPRLALGAALTSRRMERLLRSEEKNAAKRAALALRFALTSQGGAYLAGKEEAMEHTSPKLHAKVHNFLGKGV